MALLLLIDISFIPSEAEPSITDWIQAIGVIISAPAVLYGIWKLLKERKEKMVDDIKRDKEISALTDIAITQNAILGNMKEQLKEFQDQTKQIQYQSFLFNESNDILRSQIELMQKAHDHEQSHKTWKREIEEKKRKAAIKPYFQKNGGHSDPDSLSFSIINIGKQAVYVKIEEVNLSEIYLRPRCKEGMPIESMDYVVFNGSKKDNVNCNLATYEFNFIFKDVDGNIYQQNIKGKGGSIDIENPTEVNI